MVVTVDQECHFKAMALVKEKKYFLGIIKSKLTLFLEQMNTLVAYTGNVKKSALLLLSAKKNVQTHQITVKFGQNVIESLLYMKIN